MDDDDDVHDQVGDPEHVRIVRPGFGPLEELHHPDACKHTHRQTHTNRPSIENWHAVVEVGVFSL